MNAVLAGLHAEVCIVYLNDIIVHSIDFDSPFDRLEKLLKWLVEAALKLKVSRCRLLYDK